MALAFLELIDSDEAGHELQIDTGTNTQFEIRLGDSVVRRASAEFVDNVFQQTALATAEGAGDPLAPPQTIRLRTSSRPGRRVYAQLYSYKAGRRAPAFSDVVELPPLLTRRPPVRRSAAQSVDVMNATPDTLGGVRRIPHTDLADATSTGFDTILAEILKIAQPVVAGLLKTSASESAATGSNPSVDIVAGLLKAALAAIPGASTTTAAAPVSQAKSLESTNRFNGEHSEAFIFGIDDALIGAAIGPLVQILPQLANAANQKDKDRRAADQAFISGILKDINQRMLLDKVLEAQRQAALTQQWAAGSDAPAVKPEDLAAIAALLAQAQPAPATAAAKSMSLVSAAPTAPPAAPAARAILEPLPPPALDWSGGRDALYARDKRLALRFRFAVGAPVPAKPLDRAILTVTLVDDSNAALRAEKSVRLTALAPNAEVECLFEPGELAHLPAGSRLTARGSLRWPGKSRTVEALGSTQIVLVGPLFVKALGNEVGGERELTDMRRWRAFWNKLWEAPTLDRSDDSKRRWRLDADVRYTVLLAANSSNGIMETRHRPPDQSDDPDYAQTIGRVKAGIEIGLTPLAQLRSLWDLGDLPAEAATALSDRAFLSACGGELQRRVELKGRAGERGLVWAIPTFRLFDVKLCRIGESNAAGVVTKTTEETIQLPLPVGVRLIGLRSQ